jgi:hypothetical protein
MLYELHIKHKKRGDIETARQCHKLLSYNTDHTGSENIRRGNTMDG